MLALSHVGRDDHGDQEMTLVMERIEHQAIIRGSQVAVTAEVGVVAENSIEVMHGRHLFRFSSVNTGTEHAVAVSESVERVNITDVGQAVRYHPALAPAGANVSIAQALDDHLLRIRTYERGVEAETLSCGSGAVAAVVIARLAGSISAGPVTVLNEAGTPLIVDCPDDPRNQAIWLTGPAEVTYRGDVL